MKSIDVNMLKEMYISGANNLYNHYPEIDQLNVFPVPDGDTGMNMNLTVTSGAKEIAHRNDNNVYDLATAFSKGLLMGARGNSGVITSQIFRGFARALEGLNVISPIDLANAFDKAREVAYKAVMKPIEGTILTVIRESSASLLDFVKNKKDCSIEEAMDYFLQEAKASLERTPDLLPVLKEVGVVDSGGAGLCTIIEGMNKAVHKDVIVRLSEVGSTSSPIQQKVPLYAGAQLSEDEEGYGYCTQFILQLQPADTAKKPFDEKRFKNFLISHGKSVVVVRDDDIVKVHVHTLTPGNMLNYAQNYGEFLSIVIENMSEEHKNLENGLSPTDMASNIGLKKEAAQQKVKKEKKPAKPKTKYGIIAVSNGKGLDELFTSYGVTRLVSGGQTMNPSTQDFLDAIDDCNAENIFILPNNSNIVMTASQACDVLENSGINVRVVPSKTIPQGLVSVLQFNEDLEPDDVYAEMKSALKNVESGSVTYAIKDTDIEGVRITKGFYMGMKDKAIVSCVKDKNQAVVELLDSMVSENSGIITLIIGSDVSEEEEKEVTEKINQKFSSMCDIDIKRGDQSVYSYLVGVE